MDGWMSEWMDGWMSEWMDGWMSEWMDGWMSEWIDGWMSEWMDGWISELDFDHNLVKAAVISTDCTLCGKSCRRMEGVWKK